MSRQKQEAAGKRRELSARWRKLQDEVDKLPSIKASDLDLYEDKEEYVSVSDTEIEVRKRFLPKNLNVMNTLFGGDLLSWMDNAAIYCARHFTKNEHMVTMSMNRVLFKLPILASNIVTVKARVANVRYANTLPATRCAFPFSELAPVFRIDFVAVSIADARAWRSKWKSL